MHTTSTNGVQTSALAALESLRMVIDKLEADLRHQQQENNTLRAERDEALAKFEAMKEFVHDLPEWEKFNPEEYTLTTDDILAELRAM